MLKFFRILLRCIIGWMIGTALNKALLFIGFDKATIVWGVTVFISCLLLLSFTEE